MGKTKCTLLNLIRVNIFRLSLMLLIPLVNVAYWYLNNPSRGLHYIATGIDQKVPFIKLFIIPYFMWYPFVLICLLYFCFYHTKTYYKVVFSIVFGLMSCYIIYYFFQTTVPRPELYGNDILTCLIRFIYTMDKPYNCFPSIHVLLCYLMIRGMNETRRGFSINKVLTVIMAITIMLSTQFTKQHVILDLVSAVFQGEVIYRMVSISLERSWLVFKNQSWILSLRKKLEI